MTLTALLRWNNTAEPISLTVQMNYNDITALYMCYNGGWLLNWIVVYLAWAEAEQKHDSKINRSVQSPDRYCLPWVGHCRGNDSHYTRFAAVCHCLALCPHGFIMIYYCLIGAGALKGTGPGWERCGRWVWWTGRTSGFSGWPRVRTSSADGSWAQINQFSAFITKKMRLQ